MMEQVAESTGRRYTLAEYFEIDGKDGAKYEFRDGELIAMAGGTESHSLITTNIIRAIGNRLDDTPCRVYESNMRVRAKRRVRYTYPDTVVVCGSREFDDDDPNRVAITNPDLVVEVLSESTEARDRGEKFDHYIRCPTLKQYVLVRQDTAHVQTCLRQSGGQWLFNFYEGLDAVAKLQSLDLDIPLREIYAKVLFPPPKPEGPIDPRDPTRT